MREAKEFQKSDERILGDGDFVEQVLSACDEKMERRYCLKAKELGLRRVIASFITKTIKVKGVPLHVPLDK